MRLAEARADAFRRLARREGYRSRAAYKLLELDRRFGLLAPGMRVLDLGAAPGSWLQVASSRVGRGGLVVGVDLLEIKPVAPNVITLRADLRDRSLLDQLRPHAPFDLILFDASPNLTGIAEADARRHGELLLSAAGLTAGLLREGGAGVYKLFEHQELREAEAALRALFSSARRYKPGASRRRGRELYLVCRGFRGA